MRSNQPWKPALSTTAKAPATRDEVPDVPLVLPLEARTQQDCVKEQQSQMDLLERYVAGLVVALDQQPTAAMLLSNEATQPVSPVLKAKQHIPSFHKAMQLDLQLGKAALPSIEAALFSIGATVVVVGPEVETVGPVVALGPGLATGGRSTERAWPLETARGFQLKGSWNPPRKEGLPEGQ